LVVSCRGEELHQPVLAGVLVVIDVGEEIAGRVVEAGIAGDRDVRGRAMHIGDLVRDARGRKRLDPGAGARRLVVVGDDDAQAGSPAGTSSTASDSSASSSVATAVGADADVDPHERCRAR
jgi:hypothetical protein